LASESTRLRASAAAAAARRAISCFTSFGGSGSGAARDFLFHFVGGVALAGQREAAFDAAGARRESIHERTDGALTGLVEILRAQRAARRVEGAERLVLPLALPLDFLLAGFQRPLERLALSGLHGVRVGGVLVAANDTACDAQACADGGDDHCRVAH